MLRKFAAALLATTLIAGPAFAAQPSGSAGSPAPAATAGAKTAATPTAPTKHLRKHARSHARKHVARRSDGRIKTVHHLKAGKTHKAHAAPAAKSGHVGKTAAVQPSQSPASRSN